MPHLKGRGALNTKEALDSGLTASGFLARETHKAPYPDSTCGYVFCLNPKVYLVSWISVT